MALRQGVLIDGHVDSTIYTRGGIEFISLKGEEIEVLEYRPSPSSVPIKVVKRGQIYSTIQGEPTTGDYGGTDIMERISHDISAFWTQLSFFLDSVKDVVPIDSKAIEALSERMINSLHACGNEIVKEREQTRSALLEVESLKVENNQRLQELRACASLVETYKNKSTTYSSALNCVFRPPEDFPRLPLLHRLCLHNSASTKEIITEYKLDVHELADYPLFPVCGVDWCKRMCPIHIAALHGNIEAVKQLYEYDPTVIEDTTDFKMLGVLDFAAYSSLECFELCKSWVKPKATTEYSLLPSGSTQFYMAVLGGRVDVLHVLVPSPSSLFANFNFTFWHNALLYACRGNQIAVMDWLATFGGAQQYLSDTSFCSGIFWSVRTFSLPCMKWLYQHCDTKALTTRNTGTHSFQHRLAAQGWVAGLEWLSSLPGFSLSTKSYFGQTLMHLACQNNSVSVLEWAFHHPSLKPQDFHILDVNEKHMVHFAAYSGSLDCLKWICKNIPEFRHVPGSKLLLSLRDNNKQTVLHLATENGDLDVLDWFRSVHGADFAKDADIYGRLPIHIASGRLKTLNWMAPLVDRRKWAAEDNEGRTPFLIAVLNDDVAAVHCIASIDVSLLLQPAPIHQRTVHDHEYSDKMDYCLRQYGIKRTKPR